MAVVVVVVVGRALHTLHILKWHRYHRQEYHKHRYNRGGKCDGRPFVVSGEVGPAVFKLVIVIIKVVVFGLEFDFDVKISSD